MVSKEDEYKDYLNTVRTKFQGCIPISFDEFKKKGWVCKDRNWHGD